MLNAEVSLIQRFWDRIVNILILKFPLQAQISGCIVVIEFYMNIKRTFPTIWIWVAWCDNVELLRVSLQFEFGLCCVVLCSDN
jgi:hypothetical protein